MKLTGHVIELDPTKQYLILVDQREWSKEETARLASKMKEGLSGLILHLPTLDSIRFVENSDRIIDIIQENETII